MRDLINITDEAKSYINKLCGGDGRLIKVRINNKGCSGHSFEYSTILDDDIKKFDEVMRWPGGGLVIDGSSVMHVIGSTLELKSSLMENFLSWNNPQAGDHCGCGVSFSLKS
jgi:iron-sulfur cluster assembly protein